MEVSKVNRNYFGVKPVSHGEKANLSKVSFSGSVASELNYIRQLCGNPKMAKFVLENPWLEKMQGELGGILITAIGTGAVAPFPIAFNPFVKAKPDATEEEKKEVSRTKKYTALRQPISAVIAALFQAGAQPFIDKFLDYLTNNPESAKKWWVFLDQSAINKESYLKRNIKEQMKKELADGTLVLDGENQKEAFKTELNRRVKTEHARQIDNVAKILKNEGTVKIGDRAIDAETMTNLFNKNIDKYISNAEKLKIHSNSNGLFKGRDFYLTRAEDLIDNEAEFKRIFAPDKLPPLVKNPTPEDIDYLNNYLKEEIKNAKNNQIKTILQEILDKDDPVVRRSRCNRTLERIACIKNLCGGEFSLEKYSEVMKEQNSILAEKIDGLKSLKLDPKTATIEQIKQAMEELIEKCHYDSKNPLLKKLFGEDNRVFGSVKKDLEKRVYTDIVNTYQALVKARFTGVSQALKVLTGVIITLPISCTVLNWVYPRFMEICFPDLAGIKKGDEPVQNKKGEINA